MNTTKKIIGLGIILGLAVISFILFGNKMNNNNASTATSTASSTMSSIMSKVSEVTIKDNKTIELAPKDLSIWSSTENVITSTTEIWDGYAGINGSKYYLSPKSGINVNYSLGVVNSSFQQSEAAKASLESFKTASKQTSNPNNVGFGIYTAPFRNISEAGGYAKVYIKDVVYTKPSNFDTLRVVVTKDGQSGELVPTINLMGQRGNDYFLLENQLRDFESADRYKAASAACNGSNVDKCIDIKYQAAIDLFLTPELIKTKTDLAISALN